MLFTYEHKASVYSGKILKLHMHHLPQKSVYELLWKDFIDKELIEVIHAIFMFSRHISSQELITFLMGRWNKLTQ